MTFKRMVVLIKSINYVAHLIQKFTVFGCNFFSMIEILILLLNICDNTIQMYPMLSETLLECCNTIQMYPMLSETLLEFCFILDLKHFIYNASDYKLR